MNDIVMLAFPKIRTKTSQNDAHDITMTAYNITMTAHIAMTTHNITITALRKPDNCA